MAASDFPNLRLLKIPLKGTQELQTNFKSSWQPSSHASSGSFSAVGFLYGRYLHQILKAPVSLIDNSWGGSAAEAWVRRETLEKEPLFKPLMESTVKQVEKLMSAQAKADLETARTKWKVEVEKAKAEGTKPPNAPTDWLTAQYRPGNIFAGMLNATIGYGIKGVIWYQGETNADRAAEYRDLFPFMITQWRKEWGQGDFPFYWVQLADFKAEKSDPGESAWAELREAQTLTMKLPNTGQAVIIDVGEGKDIHPHNKLAVAARYAWADNPVCNLYSESGLPVTPFRTDHLQMITQSK